MNIANNQQLPEYDNVGLLPMIISETGTHDEPEIERIICSSISGGADYVNGMPREVSLERITAEGSTFARYIQTDLEVAMPSPTNEVAS